VTVSDQMIAQSLALVRALTRTLSPAGTSISIPTTLQRMKHV